MNCIFCCVFNEKKYLEMFLVLLESIHLYGNLIDTDILIYTSSKFKYIIENHILFNQNIVFEINDTIDNIDKSCKSRLDLFNLSIDKYDKILYLDTDIIIKDDINKVFNICSEEILYVLEEGTIDDGRDFWGKTLFDKNYDYVDKTAFTSGILLFKNCNKIKDLFNQINEHMNTCSFFFDCYDQPYIVYNAFKNNMYNNKILKSFAINNDSDINSNKVIHHFPGYPGIYEKKIKSMNCFLNDLNKNNFKNGIKIYDVNYPPCKNTSISLIGIVVSYNYFDTLKFVLPVNYLHFEHIYIITQPDDIETINLCNTFDNVKVLFYDFKNNNKKFDKFGALNYGQKIVYTNHPDSWYLLFDSDVILPNNFIDVLNNESLNPECIYGAIRNNVNTSSELKNKKNILNNNENMNYIYNSIIYLKNTVFKHVPPCIIGSFQLYKKKVYHLDNLVDAGYGDYAFCHSNFELFSNFDNILYFHLGEGKKNWSGKITYFVDDAQISLNDIYYKCHKKVNNIYYDKNCDIVQYGNSQNIDYDIWTCSDKMRYDIYMFFKNSHYKIAEIGSHKGYTTKILSNIFSQVYAVDNHIEWTNMNKEFNKDSTNIEYILLDIYKNDWNVLPNDIEVSFIDANHDYESCKSDIVNSIKIFKNIKYFIFDDYGVWPGVKKIVDELIQNKTLLFERFIGKNNVLGPNGIVENTHEGIICKLNKNNPRNLKKMMYT